MTALLTFAEYAAAIGVNASTVSRGVKKGTIPFIELADGRRMIDRTVADSARRRSTTIRHGHGGRQDRAIRQQAIWKSKTSTGFDPQVLAILNVMRTSWPSILKQAMAVLGAAEIDQARALLALAEMREHLAVALHYEFSRVVDYRTVLEPESLPEFTNKAARQFLDRWGDIQELGSGRWTDEGQGLPGGSDVYELMADAAIAASPKGLST